MASLRKLAQVLEEVQEEMCNIERTLTRSIQDLKCLGVKFTPELEERVINEIKARFRGKRDGVLHEPLGQIIQNEYTVIKLKEELTHPKNALQA